LEIQNGSDYKVCVNRLQTIAYPGRCLHLT